VRYLSPFFFTIHFGGPFRMCTKHSA
jgi:hypothetical protein